MVLSSSCVALDSKIISSGDLLLDNARIQALLQLNIRDDLKYYTQWQYVSVKKQGENTYKILRTFFLYKNSFKEIIVASKKNKAEHIITSMDAKQGELILSKDFILRFKETQTIISALKGFDELYQFDIHESVVWDLVEQEWFNDDLNSIGAYLVNHHNNEISLIAVMPYDCTGKCYEISSPLNQEINNAYNFKKK